MPWIRRSALRFLIFSFAVAGVAGAEPHAPNGLRPLAPRMIGPDVQKANEAFIVEVEGTSGKGSATLIGDANGNPRWVATNAHVGEGEKTLNVHLAGKAVPVSCEPYPEYSKEKATFAREKGVSIEKLGNSVSNGMIASDVKLCLLSPEGAASAKVHLKNEGFVAACPHTSVAKSLTCIGYGRNAANEGKEFGGRSRFKLTGKATAIHTSTAGNRVLEQNFFNGKNGNSSGDSGGGCVNYPPAAPGSPAQLTALTSAGRVEADGEVYSYMVDLTSVPIREFFAGIAGKHGGMCGDVATATPMPRPPLPHGPLGANAPKVSALWVGYPADKAGVKTGDRILGVNDIPINTRTDFENALASLGHGKTPSFPVKVLREGKQITLNIPTADFLPERNLGVDLSYASTAANPPVPSAPPSSPARLRIVPASPAATSGLQRGDQILSLAGIAISDLQSLRSAETAVWHVPSLSTRRFALRVRRSGVEQTLWLRGQDILNYTHLRSGPGHIGLQEVGGAPPI